MFVVAELSQGACLADAMVVEARRRTPPDYLVSIEAVGPRATGVVMSPRPRHESQ